jgi:hypothetical protein
MKIGRVRKHKVYVDTYLNILRFEIVNASIQASRSGGVDSYCADKINSKANLIRKYERRKKILSY